MPDLQTALRTAGFSDDEISSYLTGQRNELRGAGFNDNEIDQYFGAPQTPAAVPDAMATRFDEGAAAQKRVGGLLQTVPQFFHLLSDPDGRTKLWNAIKQYPEEFAKGMLQQAEIPGDVYAGKIDLNTDEGIDQAIGLGTLVALGRLNKMPLTGKTAGVGLVGGEQMARIDRDATGNIHETPIGQLPTGQDFTDAGNALTQNNTTPAVEGKLATLYQERGVHPAEVAHDAQSDPTIAQSMASSDPQDLPSAYKEPPAPPPAEPPATPPTPPEPPEPPPYSDAEKSILSKISIGEKTPTEPLTFDRLYTNFVDRLFPISKAVKEADIEGLTTDDNPYQLARMLTGYVGKADHFLNQGTFDFNTYENNGASLKEILQPVSDDLNGFRAYMASRRVQELESRGVEHGFDLDAANTVVSEGAGKYEKPFRELVDYQNRVSQYLRDSGVLSDAGYRAMLQANKQYVPFSRVMGIDEAAQARGGSSLQARNPVKKIKGSSRDIVDPLESIVRNTYHFVEMAEKNQVGTKLIDMLKRAGQELPEAPAEAAAQPISDTARGEAISEALKDAGISKSDALAQSLAHATEPTREGEIAILRDGKRETYSVDPELARAMKGLDAQSMGLLEKILSFPASTLRAGAVLTPDFAIRHTIRDFLYATTTFKNGVFHPLDMAKGFTGLIMKDTDYWNWLKGGGGNVSYLGIERRYLQNDLQKLTAETGLVGRAWNVLTDPQASMWQKAGTLGKLPFQAISKFVLDPLRTITNMAENASHLAAFKKTMRAQEAEPEPQTLRQQIINSAWASRDTAVDAMRMGANMRAYNLVTAFANIKLQDTDRIVRAIRDNPIKTLTMLGGAVTAPAVIGWLANHDDPRWKEIPQWEKDMFQIVMTKDHIYRIPRPWAAGIIFGALPERLLDAYAAENPDAFKDFFKSLWQTSGPDFVPTAAAPIIDQFANRSTFTNRTLIPSDQEKLLPEYQYTPYTTELTKKLGKVIGAFPGISELKMDNSGWGGTARALTSPILMENYIRGWTGGLGMYALDAADAALRKAGKLPDPPQPTPTLADIPVIRAFVVRYPTASTESIQSFYDDYNRNKTYFDTYMAKAQEGDAAAMQHIQEMGGPQMFARLDGIAQVLGQHSKLIRDIYKNPQIPSDEKRQLIDQLYNSMIQIGQYGRSAMQQIEQAAGAQTVH